MQRKHINKNQKRIEQEEKELAELMSKNKDKAEVKEEPKEETEVQEEEPTTKEEQTFKKRYGDLRRHLSQKRKRMVR